ncbi:MAG TPA: DUF4112 domain-containing protein [Gemmatimonadales bacterium]|nr:DUF4112 domain-containing protein [Gemmatimonadales bacterium]
MVKSAAPLAPAPRLGAAELERLEQLRRLGYLLDNSIPIPGTSYRIGLEAIIGLVPGLGDLVGGGFSAWIVLQAARLGTPPSLVARMGWNLLVDAVVGAVPLLGDLFDAGYKANLRNLALLERHVQGPDASRRASRRFVAVLALLLVLLLVGAATLAVLLVQLLLSRPVL